MTRHHRQHHQQAELWHAARWDGHKNSYATGWMPVALFTSIAAGVSAVSAWTARETCNVPMSQLGNQNPLNTVETDDVGSAPGLTMAAS